MNDLDKIMEEIQNGISLQQISKLLEEGEYIPFTDSSLSFSSLVNVLNDISINGRANVVEFGAGTSTLIIGKLLKSLKGKRKLLSVEHDEKWANYLTELVADRNLNEVVCIVHIPLEKSEICKHNNTWYSLEAVKNNIEKIGLVDCVLVDGPPAYEKGKEEARFPAFSVVHEYLSANCSVFLDDTWRHGEKEILQLWSEGNEFQVEKFSASFAGLFRGRYYNIRLPKAKF